MNKNIKTKQIAFNLNDPFQKELYEYASKFKNFSFYGKMLIKRDMEGWNKIERNEIEMVEKISIDEDILKSFI